MLAAPFPLALTLARTGDVAISVHAGLAYPNGFTFRMKLVRRQPFEGREGDPFHHWHRRARSGEIAPEALRFGVRFADGSKATVFDGHRWFARTETPAGPVLIQRGGHGGMRSWDFGFWVWPLPPEGPLAFVVEWPSEGIELREVELDAAPIRAAAERAEILWPDDSGPSGSGGWVASRRVG